MGSLYRRGKVWWIKYYRNGKSYRESSGTSKKMIAKKLLNRREGDIALGKLPGINFEKVTFDELTEDFLRDYRINQKKSIARAERSVACLKTGFEGLSVPKITSSMIDYYVEDRLRQGAANATINRELSALKRMLNLGANQTPPKVDRVPHIPMLEENNIRKGFFEHSEFLALRNALPSHLKDVATFAYKIGWRHSEITKLKWSQVDLPSGIIRLEAGMSKNKEPRTVYLDDELHGLLNKKWLNRKASGSLLPWVFLNKAGNDRVKRFYKAWKTACKDSKIGIRLFHDFRRTAVRNMVRSGIPERVAMMVSGHKTRSVFDRYNIVDEKDLKQAASKQQTYLENLTGTISGTIHQFEPKSDFKKSS